MRECTCDRLVEEGKAISASCSAGFRAPLLQQVHLSRLRQAAPQLATECSAAAYLLQTLEPYNIQIPDACSDSMRMKRKDPFASYFAAL